MATRPIKFRAWRKSWAMMVLPEWITKLLNDNVIYGLVFNNPCTNGHTEIEDWDDVDANDIVFMQFTGLVDAKGREIYEGDILEYLSRRGAVEWDESGQFAVRFPADSGFNWRIGSFNTKDMKIIGNVYQNPKLLK